MICKYCNGKGHVLTEAINGVGFVSKHCPVCHGRGEVKITENDVLVLVDMQNGFHNEFTTNAVESLKHIIEEYKLTKIMAVKYMNFSDSMFTKTLGYEELKSKPSQDIISDFVTVVSAVFLHDTYQTVNDEFLNQLRILNDGTIPQRVLVAGMDTEACVLAICTGLFDKGIKPVVLSDCVASSQGIENHKYGLKIMETMFGIEQIIKLG